jgi:hypothetical protein
LSLPTAGRLVEEVVTMSLSKSGILSIVLSFDRLRMTIESLG